MVGSKQQTKKVSPSPALATKPKSTTVSSMGDPSLSVPKSQLKSPPELLSKNSTSKSPSSLESRRVPLAAAAVINNEKPPTPTSLQSKIDLTDSWIDTLKKHQASCSPPKSRKGNEKNEDEKAKDPTKCTTAKGDVIISNLEESYFKRPTPKRVKHSSSQKMGLFDKGTSSLPLEEDECSRTSSEATQHHSNKSSKKSVRQQIMPMNQIKEIRNDPTSSKTKDTKESVAAAHKNESSEMARSKADSEKLVKERNEADEKFEADLKRAMAESQQSSPYVVRNKSARSEVIVLDDSDDDDVEDAKMPAKVEGNFKTEHKPTASTTTTAVDNSKIKEDEDAQMNEAIRLSLEEAEKAKQPQYRYSDSTIPQTCRTLNPFEFQDAVDSFVADNGGYGKIEGGQMIKHGNANDMKRSCVVEGGGLNQSGAQYGRYSIERMWRVFDVLEGKDDINIDESDMPVKDGNSTSAATSKTTENRKRERNERNSRIPGAKEIKAFVDIGHGIGIQVLQAGWSLGVPARGVEIMKNRHLIATAIQEGVLEILRNDPPDSTMVDLKLADFSWAIVPNKKSGRRDEELRRFLLMQDKSELVQKGLVIFINNAEEVFAARSNLSAKGVCLDAHLANLFANMKVGGRMVTLTDVSSHLNQSSEWFRRDVFQSGTKAVSWGGENKSINVYVLTKLSDEWFCQNKRCEARAAAPNAVVDGNGDLNELCIYCNAPAMRCSRIRKPSHKRRKEDE
ncbi:hypothetical protein ACHAXR_003673 [Thalassiosira sp. AJA248-18]